MKFTVVAVYQYRLGKSLAENRHKVPWLWMAKALVWSYVYGTIIMPLAGADVIDVYIKERESV